jgi:hypothetical protein
VVAGVIWVAAGVARAQEPALTWQAPEGCPTRDAWLSALRARVDDAAWNEAAPKLRASVRIDLTETGYALQLDTELDGASGQRRIEAARCEELVDASALIVAFAIDPNAASRAASATPRVASDGLPPVVAPTETEADVAPVPVPAPPKPVEPKKRMPPVDVPPKGYDPERPTDHLREPARSGTGLLVRPLWLFDVGTLPTLGTGPSLMVGLRIGRLSLELGASYLLAQSIADPSADRVIGELRWLAGSAGACYAVLPESRFDLASCLRAELGRLWGRGRNLDEDMFSGGATWLAVLVGIQVSVELVRGLELATELGAGLPLLASAFTVGGVGKVHETPSAVGRLSAGVTLVF